MIIVYGGSFNPPTIAHYKIAKYLINRFNPTQFIFVPVGDRYDKKELAPFTHRYQMLERLCNQLPDCVISDYENKKEFTGTIDTLNTLKSLYQEELYFVLGADNLMYLDQWIEFETLVKNYHFIVFNRNQSNVLNLINSHKLLHDYQHHFVIIDDFEPISISSSDYRHELKDEVVIETINDYIYKHKLYSRGEKNEK